MTASTSSLRFLVRRGGRRRGAGRLANFDDLLAAFGRYGWIARPSAAFPTLLALHWLREAGHTEASSRKMHDYRFLIAQVQQDPALIDAVMASAVDADAVQTARPFLTELGFDVAEERNPSEALRRWNLNVHARHRMTGWMLQLREASVWQKPGVIMRAVFPSASDLRAIDPQIGDGRAAVVAGWWRRFARGVRSAPQVVHDLREHYRSD